MKDRRDIRTSTANGTAPDRRWCRSRLCDDAFVAATELPEVYVPTPALVGAWFALHRPLSHRVPLWAAYWVAAGYDGEALVQLAGLDGRDVRDVEDLLPDALAEMAVGVPNVLDAARLVFADLSLGCLDGSIDERIVARAVEEIYVESGYSSAVAGLPLGALVELEDEWQGKWGRGVEDLGAAVRAACRAQLDA